MLVLHCYTWQITRRYFLFLWNTDLLIAVLNLYLLILPSSWSEELPTFGARIWMKAWAHIFFLINENVRHLVQGEFKKLPQELFIIEQCGALYFPFKLKEPRFCFKCFLTFLSYIFLFCWFHFEFS